VQQSWSELRPRRVAEWCGNLAKEGLFRLAAHAGDEAIECRATAGPEHRQIAGLCHFDLGGSGADAALPLH